MRKWNVIQSIWLIICILLVASLVLWLVNRNIVSVEGFDGYLMDANRTPIIPLDIYQTWKTKDLPPKMLECVETLKKQNPEFTHHLYDDEECYQFIKDNFDPEVAEAYDTLIPGAYKADLWRYCILYKRGGIYLDIKFCHVDDFKLISLTDREYFTLDIPSWGEGIYNAFMICLPGNKKLGNCIHRVVKNVQNRFYGNNCLEPTGPLMMKTEFTEDEIMDIKNTLVAEDSKNNERNICLRGKPILRVYQGYYGGENIIHQENHIHMWKKRKMYK